MMKRLIGVMLCAAGWVLADYLRGNPYNPQMALLAGFIAVWASEGKPDNDPN